MSKLDQLPILDNFCGLDIKIGAIVGDLWGGASSAVYIGLYAFSHHVQVNEWRHDLLAVMSLFFLIASVTLLIGLIAGRWVISLCEVWVSCAMLYIGIAALLLLAVILQLITHGKFWITWPSFGWLLIFLVFVYFTLVVNSYRFQLKDQLCLQNEEKE